MLAGKQLEDGNRLGDYAIVRESTPPHAPTLWRCALPASYASHCAPVLGLRTRTALLIIVTVKEDCLRASISSMCPTRAHWNGGGGARTPPLWRMSRADLGGPVPHPLQYRLWRAGGCQ